MGAPLYALVRYADVQTDHTQGFASVVWEQWSFRMGRYFGFATEVVDGVVERAVVYFVLAAHLSREQWRDVLKLGLEDGNVVDMEFLPPSRQDELEGQQWEAAVVAEAVMGELPGRLFGEEPIVPSEWSLCIRRPAKTKWLVSRMECECGTSDD
jgi:hypothetical protein